MHVVDGCSYAATPGRNFQKSGDSQVHFYGRGALSTNTDVKIEVADDGNIATPDPCMTLSAKRNG